MHTLLKSDAPRSRRARRCGSLFLALCLFLVLCFVAGSVITGCSGDSRSEQDRGGVDALPGSGAAVDGDLLLVGGRVYSFRWAPPAPDGTPAADAPVKDGSWSPDAEAILVREGLIAFVGSESAAREQARPDAQVIDLDGAVVLPGFVDSHTHVRELGAQLRRVNLVGVETEAEVIGRLRSATSTASGDDTASSDTDGDDMGGSDTAGSDWLIGWGWDEGAWAADYPDWNRLSEEFPERPVALYSLHGFALWANRAAFERAGIEGDTRAPTGGEIVRDASDAPTGLLLNRATTLVRDAVPPPSPTEIEQDLLAGIAEMARSGYVGVHEAGLDGETLAAFERLAASDRLDLRVVAMLSARDVPLMEEWIERGPGCGPRARDVASDPMLRVCTVKAFWDGALGSRGARLLEDYADREGHRGISGEGYGFDQELVARAIERGFQVAIHAIGDAGNRETLDFLEPLLREDPAARRLRHRVEHAQVVHPDDVARFAELGLIASMQPPHLAEDQAWAEDRLGAERVRWAYAWRSFREAGVPLVFSSDLAGSDHDLLYGLHSAVTRRPRTDRGDADRARREGFVAGEALTMEETIRAYTLAAAHAAFLEEQAGPLEEGRLADITVLRGPEGWDPFGVAMDPVTPTPAFWWDADVVLTVVGGRIVYQQAGGS